MKRELLSCLLLGCLAMPVGARTPFGTGSGFYPEDDSEAQVWKLSEVIRADSLKNRAVAAQVTPVEQYMQGVLDKLYPEFEGKLRVRLIHNVGSNAFALPNGDIYVGTGILLRMTSEAQLAALLGHEATHSTHRHGVEAVESFHRSIGAVNVVNLAIAAVPMPVSGLSGLVINPLVRMAAQLGIGFTVASSVYGFSRERESEADEVGYNRMVKAGYDPREAPKLFRAMSAEAKYADVSRPFFFASHPAMDARVESFERLIKVTKPVGLRVGSEEYEAVVGPLRVAFTERELKLLGTGASKGIIAYLERPDIKATYPPGKADFFLGEAYRRVGKEETLDKAVAAYYRAIDAGLPPLQGLEPILLIHLRMERGAAANATLEAMVAAGRSPSDADMQQYRQQVAKMLP